MNAITTKFDLSPRQLTLVKQTIAKDCNDEEFNLFCEVARAKGLDPFLKQIIPMVFSKNNSAKRNMTIIISRDGQRVIAQRCGDYRPASKPPQFEFDTDLKGPLNPKGIVSATVYLWKKDPDDGTWYEVAGQADWDEFAPVKDEWAEGQDGRNHKTGKQKLDDSGNWARMPKVMIAKCAEMQALRAGWPEQFTGLYDETELDRVKALDLSAMELVHQEQQESRLRAVGGANAVTIWWQDGFALENVPDGQLVDRVAEFLREVDGNTATRWQDANRASLQIFWSRRKGDALEIKKMIEAKASEKRAANIDPAIRNHVMAAG